MARIQRITRKRLGEILVDEGVLTAAQIKEALEHQQEHGGLLGDVLVEMGLVTERDIAKTIAKQLSLPYLSSERYDIPVDVYRLVPRTLQEKYHLIPVDRFGNVLTILASGSLSTEILDEIEAITTCRIQVFIGVSSEIATSIQRLGGDDGKKKGEKGGKAPAKEKAAAAAGPNGPAAKPKPGEKPVAKSDAPPEKENTDDLAAALSWMDQQDHDLLKELDSSNFNVLPGAGRDEDTDELNK